MALRSWLAVEEEGEEGWVEAELERELASIAHLTLQDLEHHQETDQLGFHGNEQLQNEAEAVDVKSLFSEYLFRLDGAQSQAAVLLRDARETLAHVEDSIAASTVQPRETLAHVEDSIAASTVWPSAFGTVSDVVVLEQGAVDVEGNRRSESAAGKECENSTDPADRGERSEDETEAVVENPAAGLEECIDPVELKKVLGSEPVGSAISTASRRRRGRESGKGSTESGNLEEEATENISSKLEDLEQEKNRHQEALDFLIAEKKRRQSEHAAVLAARAAREREARLTFLQARVRGWLARRTHAPLLKAAREKQKQIASIEPLLVLVQAYARGWLVRQTVHQSLQVIRMRRTLLYEGVMCVQAHVRGLLARRKYLLAFRERQQCYRRLEAMAATLQARCRGYLIRRHFQTRLEEFRKKQLRMECTLVEFQAHCRGYIIRTNLLHQLKRKRKEREQQVKHKLLLKMARTSSSPSRICAVATTHNSSVITSDCCNSATTDKTSSLMDSEGTSQTASHSYNAATTPTRSNDYDEKAVPGAVSPNSLSSTLCSGAPTGSLSGSPRKNKLTVERRLQSSLKALSFSGIDNTSDTRDDRNASHTPRNSASDLRTCSRNCASDLRTCSSPSLMTNVCEGVTVSQSMGVTSSRRGVPADGPEGADTPEGAAATEGEGGELAAEAQALEQVVRSREEELAKAQQARERMSAIFSAEEVQLMAERQRKRNSYQLELESACSPLLPVAWLGLVEERLESWKKTHLFHPRQFQRSPAEDHGTTVLTANSGTQPISRAQLLAASRRGTQLEEVVQVVLYRSRKPLSLSSLQQCPNLRTLSLAGCGLNTLDGPSAQHCPQLTELIVQSNDIKQISLGQQDKLCFLDLSENHLAFIHGISRCPALLHLTLTGNRVARVNGLTGCLKLQRLTLDSNLLINTKGLEGLSDLEYLSCCENHLPVVDGLSQSHCLQHLLLSQNNLQQVPVLTSHVLLRELNLEENSISDVSPITDAWLPLLQTLCLANNCISHMSSLVCLIMLQHLDLTLNSLFDLPLLLQALRGCYNLSTLLISGNPVTQERQFRTHLIRTLPSLRKLVVNAERGMMEVGVGGEKRKQQGGVPEQITSSNIYSTCLVQIQEQDSLQAQHRQQLETLTGVTGDTSELLPPEVIVQALELRVSQCERYHQLLLQHLAQQECLEAGKWRDRLEQARAKAEREKRAVLEKERERHAVLEKKRLERERHAVLEKERLEEERRAVLEKERLEEEHARAKAKRERDTVLEKERLKRERLLWWAAVTVQARWRGLCGCRLAAARREERRLERMNYAATRIQAYFRGWCLRQRLYAVMECGCGNKATPIRADEEEFNYEEEIVLDFLDEEMLEVGLDDPGPVPSPRKCGQSGGATMLFGVPGQATGTEVSYEEWKAAYKLHAQQEKTSSTLTAPPQATEPDSAHDSTPVPPVMGGMSGSVLVAWDSCGSERRTEKVQDRPLEGGKEEDSHQDSCANAERRKDDEEQPKRRNIIKNEWGFASEKTASLMWRRAQRQKHFQTAGARRKKLQDPATRLAHFKKQHLASHTHSFGHSPPHAGQDESVPGESAGSGKLCSSPSLEELAAKEHFQYQWQHRLRAGHRVPPIKLAPPSPPEHHSYSSLLPHLDPHVLAGHHPRLVSAEADRHMGSHTGSRTGSKKS